MINENAKIIAVDFDGTIVEDAYPGIGKPKPFAFEVLKQLERDGHRLILWTVRIGKELSEAVEFCKKNGVDFYAVNANFPDEVYERRAMSRKVKAEIFIDDRNVGGMKGWGEIYQEITGSEPMLKPKQSILKKLFKK